MKEKWMQKAFSHSHGQLHKSLHVPKGSKIPYDDLVAAAHRPGITGKRARLALTARRVNR